MSALRYSLYMNSRRERRPAFRQSTRRFLSRQLIGLLLPPQLPPWCAVSLASAHHGLRKKDFAPRVRTGLLAWYTSSGTAGDMLIGRIDHGGTVFANGKDNHAVLHFAVPNCRIPLELSRLLPEAKGGRSHACMVIGSWIGGVFEWQCLGRRSAGQLGTSGKGLGQQPIQRRVSSGNGH